VDTAGRAVEAGAYYHFLPGRGVLTAGPAAAGSCPGRVLLALAAEELIGDADDLKAARALPRGARPPPEDASRTRAARSVAKLERAH
jgi:hypothetical protein